MPTAPLSSLGAIAVELAPGEAAQRACMTRDKAGELAALLARDLERFAPDVATLDLVLAAGLYDPAELLRPGWPLHAELERLCAQAPGAHGRVIGFGAAEDALPGSLQPSTAFGPGPLRLVPWLLRGDADTIARIGPVLEDGLLENGMAAADTALLVQDAFGAPVEHVRYLTVHDLAAMIALQYEHAGLAGVWPLLETALLAPGGEAWLDNPPEPLVRYHDGQARIALLDFDAWMEGGFAPAAADPTRLTRAFERFEMRQRQIAAVLEAHGLPVTYDHCPSGQDPRAILRA